MNIVPRGLVEFFKNVRDFREIQRFFDGLASVQNLSETTINAILSDITALEANVATLFADVATLQGQVSALQSDVAALQAEVDGKLEVTGTGGASAWDDIVNTGIGRAITTGTGASEKRMLWDPQMTHGVKAGSAYLPHIHFCPSSIPGATQVSKWELSYITFNTAGDLSNAARLTTTTVYVPIYATDIQYGYVTRGFYTSNTVFDAGTRFSITNANMTQSSIYSILLRRKSGDAGDTYTGGSVYVFAFDGHIEINRRGTGTEFS
jgi:outer membrane murein-binding lipoprotein Lpp